MHKTWVAAVVLAVASLVAGCTTTATTSPPRDAPTHQVGVPSALPRSTVLASYPGGNTVYNEIREQHPRADGYYHIDTRKTVAQLKALHVNTYLFLIWHSPTDWQDLHQFLPAAQRAGIDVWVYLVPPSECDLPSGWCSRPYKTDYVAWGRHIAQLSRQHSNLTAWAIDDFMGSKNSAVLTPQYVREIQHTADTINPHLGLYTTAYYSTAINNAFYEKYAPYIRGIIFPFLDQSSGSTNTQVTTAFRPELDAVTAKADKYGVKVLLMIYSGRYSTLNDPTKHYVQSALDTGMSYIRRGRIEGVCSYGTPHKGALAVSSDNLAMFGHGSLVFQNQGGSTPGGSYESASQTVQVEPNAQRYNLSFWRYSRYYSAPIAGRLMQVLINGHPIWSSDIATDQSVGAREYRWTQQTDNGPPIGIDPSYLRGKTKATLTFRIYERQAANFRSLTAFDSVQTSGFRVINAGFETPSSWRLATNSGNLIPEIDIYDRNLPSAVFRTVAHEYAG